MSAGQERLSAPPSASGKSPEAVARACADVAARIIRQAFGRRPSHKVAKGRGNFVTETDLAVEEAVLTLLRQEYPGHTVLSEETAGQVDRWREGWLWVLDPLDGTRNFARGIPIFAFNIALCLDGEPVLGLTHNPMTGEEFFAAKGCGLWVDGRRARVSGAPSLRESVLGFGLGYDYGRAGKLLALLTEIWPNMETAFNIGSAALGLAYAASGRFDVYLHHQLFPWDMAAGIVQVREGGGVIVGRDGGEVTIFSEGVIAGAPGPVRDLLLAAGERPWR